MNGNTRCERFRMWLLAPLTWQPPTLAIMNRRATLRWAWTGRMEDAKKLGPDLVDGIREGLGR